MEGVEVEVRQLYFGRIVALSHRQEPNLSSPPSKDEFVARLHQR